MKVPFNGYRHATFPKGNVTQWFGENFALYHKAVCHEYCMAGHNGLDIVNPWGTPLFAVKGGIIGDVKNDPKGYGKHLRIYHDRGDGFCEEWTYGHLSEVSVQSNHRVVEGDLVGKMGNTGFVVSGATPFWKHNPYAGTHLHLGKRLWKLWDGAGQFTMQVGTLKLVGVVDYHNGFYGNVDFSKELGEAAGVVDTPEMLKLRLTLASLQNSLAKIITGK